MNVRKQEETPDGYLARARAVFKIGRTHTARCADTCCGWASLGEFLHQADIEGV